MCQHTIRDIARLATMLAGLIAPRIRLGFISISSRLCLDFVLALPQLLLGFASATSRLCLSYVSALPQLRLGYASTMPHLHLDHALASISCEHCRSSRNNPHCVPRHIIYYCHTENVPSPPSFSKWCTACTANFLLITK